MSNIKEVIINTNKPADVKFVQYDTNQKLYVKNSPDFDFTNTTEIQITDGTQSAARYRFTPYGDGGIVDLPDTMFQHAGILKGYIFSVDASGHTTEALVQIGIRERPVYNEYISDASEEVVIPAGFEVIQNPESVTIKAYNTDGTVTEGTVENGSDGEPGAQGLPGSDGISPSAKVEQIPTGAVVTITDKDGTTTATIENGHDGSDGISPTAKVERVTGGAKVTITDKNGTTTTNIADGHDGQRGPAGLDGVSPSIIVDTITGGHRLTITDESHGSQTVDVMDGQTGERGQQGDRGPRGYSGADGVSPTAKVEQTSTGAKVTVTDGSGTTTANLTNGRDGNPGVDGISPTATVEQTETGARVTITDKNGTTTANLTNGAQGEQGEIGPQGLPGDDGISPEASVEQLANGAKITITDAHSGTTTATIIDGEDGDDGVSPSIVIDDIPGGHRLTIFDGHHGYQYVDVMNGTGAGDVVTVTPIVESGTKIAEIDVNGQISDIYAPDPGTQDYEDLEHKPSINNVTLTGDKSLADLGIEDEIVQVTQAQYDAMSQAGTLDPTKTYFISDAQSGPVLGSAASKNYTDRLTPDSTDLPEARAVYNAISQTISGIFTPKGNIDFADLTDDLLIAANVGNVYETNDAGVTNGDWVQPAGTTIPAQSAVAIISADRIRFNYNGPAVFNLNDYQQKDLTQTTQGASTVEGALTALATDKAEVSALTVTNANVAQNASDISSLQGDISTINGKIPSNASSSNQMVTASDLNSYQLKNLAAAIQGASTVEGALSNLASQKAEQTALDTTNSNVSTLQTSANKAAVNAIFHLPYYTWADIEPTHSTELFMKNLIDILESRSDIPKAVNIFYWGHENPNSQVMVWGYTYSGSFKQYSAFHVLMYASEYLCGYANGSWYFKQYTMTI